MIAGWISFLIGCGLGACAPAYGYNVVNGTSHGQILNFASVSLWYLSVGLTKTAFATTLLRLASGKAKVALWFVIVLVSVFSVAIAIVTWVEVCEADYDMVGFGHDACLPGSLTIWIHTVVAIILFLSDVCLASLPWVIMSKVNMSTQERLGVGISMSLVGLAAVANVVRWVTSTEDCIRLLSTTFVAVSVANRLVSHFCRCTIGAYVGQAAKPDAYGKYLDWTCESPKPCDFLFVMRSKNHAC